MKMQVIDRLTCIWPAIKHKTESGLGHALIPCHLLSQQKNRAKNFRVLALNPKNISDMILGDHKNVQGRLGIGVVEG